MTTPSPDAKALAVEDVLTVWLKKAWLFIDRCSSDASDYSDNGLADDAEDLLRRGFELFGLSEEHSFVDLEAVSLALPAPVVMAEIKAVLDGAMVELQNLYFSVAGPRTYAAIDRLDDLLSRLSKALQTPAPQSEELREAVARIVNDCAAEASHSSFQRNFTRADWKLMIDMAVRHILALLPSYRPPEGYVVVPIEPTKEMLNAGWLLQRHARRNYNALLKVAPPPPSPEAQGEKL